MEYPEHVKEQYKNVKLDVFMAIELIDLKVKYGLGTEDVTMLPMDGVAVKTLLEDCKKRYNYEQHKVVCKNCGGVFTAYGRTDTYYCDRPAPQDTTKTCKEIGPILAYRKRYHDDTDWYSLYRKTYQLVQGRVKRSPKKYKHSMFSNFQASSREWIKDVKNNRKTAEEFITWLKEYRKGIGVTD